MSEHTRTLVQCIQHPARQMHRRFCSLLLRRAWLSCRRLCRWGRLPLRASALHTRLCPARQSAWEQAVPQYHTARQALSVVEWVGGRVK